MTFQTTRHGDVEIAYQVHEPVGVADPATLLLIMGIDLHSAHWGDVFLDGLTERYRVVTFDNRGTGRSTHRVDEITVELWMDDALAVLDALGIERCHVLGYSMGGRVAQELIATHPDVVDKLVLLASAIGGNEARLPRSDVLASLMPKRGAVDPDEARRHGFRLATGPEFARYPERLERLVEISRSHPTHFKVLRRQMLAADPSIAEHLRIDHPVCIIHGDADPMVPIANGEALHRHLPRARFERLPGVGHLPTWECPEALLRILRDFLG